MTSEHVVGVDFGGTNLKAGVSNAEGQLLSFVTQPTLPPHKGIDLIIDQIVKLVVRVIKESEQPHEGIIGISIGVCGLVNCLKGYVISSSVIPALQNMPLAKLVSQAVKLPVILNNDANAVLFGEWWVGAGRGMQNVVGMTLGTGIGGAAILDAKLFLGSNGNAAEFGHIVVNPDGPQCSCGNRGCLELLASATGMVQQCLQQIRQGSYSVLIEKTKGKRIKLTSQNIYEAALGGDELATNIVIQTGKYLGIGTANLLNCFNPNLMLFTGGLTGIGDWLLNIIREEARSRSCPSIYEVAQIEFGQLGNRAGVVGAAGILFHQMGVISN